MANYPIPNWALERYKDIEEFILYSMTILAETDQMKLLYSGLLSLHVILQILTKKKLYKQLFIR